MTISEKFELNERGIDRIIAMAWEDHTPFEAIKYQFGLTEQDVVKFMRKQMNSRNFRRWRARVQGRKTKHRKLRNAEVSRFKSTAQKQITGNRISKKKY